MQHKILGYYNTIWDDNNICTSGSNKKEPEENAAFGLKKTNWMVVRKSNCHQSWQV